MGKYIKKEFREIDLCPFFNEFFLALTFLNLPAHTVQRHVIP